MHIILLKNAQVFGLLLSWFLPEATFNTHISEGKYHKLPELKYKRGWMLMRNGIFVCLVV